MKKLYITLCTLLAVSAGITLQAMEPGKAVEAPETTSAKKTEPSATAKKSKQAADARNQKRFGTPDKPSTTTSSTVDLKTDTTTDHSTASTPSTGISLTEETTAPNAQPTESKMTPEDVAEFQKEFGINYTEYPNLKIIFETNNFEDKYEHIFDKNSDEANHKLVAEYMKDLKLDTLPEKLKNFVEKTLYNIINDNDGFTGQIINLPAEQGTEPTPLTSSASSSNDTLFSSEAKSTNETEQAQDNSGRAESTSSLRTISLNDEEIPAEVINEGKKVTDKSSLSKFIETLSKLFFRENSKNPEVQDAIRASIADAESQQWWSPWDGSKFQTWYENTKENFKKVKASLLPSRSEAMRQEVSDTFEDAFSSDLDTETKVNWQPF